jgi:CRP/FNR family cyclic AMP-dependent transcriptional regulator
MRPPPIRDGVIQGVSQLYGSLLTLVTPAAGGVGSDLPGAREATGPTICHVLAEDAELAEAVPAAVRNQAIDECIAALLRLQKGPWSGAQTNPMHDGIGLLVMEGTLIRNVRLGAGVGAELVGEGDLLRPWQGVEKQETAAWRVLEPARLSVLDLVAARRFARYPELIGRLVGRALDRSRSLAMNMAIVQQARIHVRVHMMLWHLADRWGCIGPEGTTLALPLSQDVLAHLVASRRPTVSAALKRLAEQGLVCPRRQGWLLSGGPPSELLALREGSRDA